MATNGHDFVKGGSDCAPASDNHEPIRNRPFTVDEALPYSPFSSILPFNSDIIPLPTIGHQQSSTIYSEPVDRDYARRGLDNLNDKFKKLPSGSTARQLEQSLRDLGHLLQPQDLTFYDFKVGPKATMKTGNTGESPEVPLTPFAKLVYNNTDILHSHSDTSLTTSWSSKTKSNMPAQGSIIKPKPQVTKNIISNHAAHKRNHVTTVEIPLPKSVVQTATLSKASPSHSPSRVAVVIPSVSNSPKRREQAQFQEPKPSGDVSSKTDVLNTTSELLLKSKHTDQVLNMDGVVPSSVPTAKHETQTSPSKKALTIMIPDLPAGFCGEEYEEVNVTPDTAIDISKKRKRAESDAGDDLVRGADWTERAQAAVEALRALLQDLFEAEDQQQHSSNMSHTFLIATIDGLSLSASTQKYVEIRLARVMDLGVFSEVAIEDLLRLQKLCEGTTKDAETVDIRVSNLMGQEEINALLNQIPKAELGLKSALIALKLMLGGREEKQLYSEDIMLSAIEAFKNIMETCLVPVVEMRSSGPASATFKLISAHKADIIRILLSIRKLLSVLANLASSIELSETVINTLEFMASRLVFVENAYVEKDSILGISKFDNLRVVAMDVLAQIFACNPSQRPGIFNNILSSLEKLPVTKQSARQFTVGKGGNIQLVSALIMLLVQASGNRIDDVKDKRRLKALKAVCCKDDSPLPDLTPVKSQQENDAMELAAQQSPKQAMVQLENALKPLRQSYEQDANYFVSHLVQKAMNSTKSGDSPYRNLLELFVQDFILCLKLPDWPAAELLLNFLMVKMVRLIHGDKSAAPAKNMALDLLGTMGAGISELNYYVRIGANSLEPDDGRYGAQMSGLAINSIEHVASLSSLVDFSGPYRATTESLKHRYADEPQMRSAIGYLNAEWAKKFITFVNSGGAEQEHLSPKDGLLAYRLRMMVTDRDYLHRMFTFQAISEKIQNLSYATIILHSPLCTSFGRIMQILLDSMASDQATVRSKSLKSINQVIETDPTILDREPIIQEKIRDRTNDSSPQVRDSALTLITKCICLRPTLQDAMLPGILRCTTDSSSGVRKRAMKLAKDIYINTTKDNRSAIADSLLHRVTDLEEGIRDLACQTIQDIWMVPFYHQTPVSSVQVHLAMVEHVELMISTVQRGSSIAAALEKVIKIMLSVKESIDIRLKNQQVCQALVIQLFSAITNNCADEARGALNPREAFHLLTMFAKSCPELFTGDQIELLQPYLSNLIGKDDLNLFRSVVTVFRHVLPNVSKLRQPFLESIRKDLQKAISKVMGPILDDVIACLWMIGGTLNDSSQLRAVVLSLINSLQQGKETELHQKPDLMRKYAKQLLICGTCGKNCDFDADYLDFQKKFPDWKEKSVSKLLTSTFAPFASPSQPLEIRKSALEAIGMVCQSWPKNFGDVAIYTTFQVAFEERNMALEQIIMNVFENYFVQEEKRSETESLGIVGPSTDPAAKLGVMGGGLGDGIAIEIARRFLGHVVHIALSAQDDHALLATRLITSISRQGLVHPKEVGPTLIALETSPNLAIAELAFTEHKALHKKHETILEKDYIRAVELAYKYQRDVCNDFHGALPSSYTAKLCRLVSVMKISKGKNRKRFYDTLCARIDFEPTKVDLERLPEHLEFSQFIIENMAFFDYPTIDDLVWAIVAMERVVAGLGTGVAYSIETELLHVEIDKASSQTEATAQPEANSFRLQQLTAYSAMLSILWEARTYLRKQYGLMSFSKEGKGKGANKDLSRPPLRVQGFNGDKFWEAIGAIMSSIENEETSMNQCKAFVELLTVDSDFKFAAEADGELVERTKFTTPSDDEEGKVSSQPGSGRGRKRKSINGGMNTPSGRKKSKMSSTPRSKGRPKGSVKRDIAGDGDTDGWD